MKKLGILVLLLSVIVAAGCSKDDDNLDPNRDVTADFDPLFAQELQKRGYIADAKKITPQEVKGITKLDVSGYINQETDEFEGKLISLRGIEYFESLAILECYGNQLTALDVSKNTMLTVLECDENQLATLDVSKNTTLTDLVCSDNQLTMLDVSKSTALVGLYCDNNHLTTLDISKNTALTDLVCSDNQLTTLDVSKNTALTWLSCDDNQLTALDIRKNTVLTELDCEGNSGDGFVFIVMAWFDNNSVPKYFTTRSWEYNGRTVRIDYRKAK